MTIKLYRPKNWRQNLPFFVMIAIVTSNHSYKSVCLVGHLSMGDNFTWPCLLYGKFLFLEDQVLFHALSYQFLHVTLFNSELSPIWKTFTYPKHFATISLWQSFRNFSTFSRDLISFISAPSLNVWGEKKNVILNIRYCIKQYDRSDVLFTV